MFISKKLVDLIEKNAEQLTANWLADIARRDSMPVHHRADPRVLHDQIYAVYSELGRWIDSDASDKDDIGRYYREFGRRRRAEGFPLAELVQALTLAKRHVWLRVLSDGTLDSALDLHRALELNNRVVLFFDRAVYFTIVGYEQAGA